MRSPIPGRWRGVRGERRASSAENASYTPEPPVPSLQASFVSTADGYSKTTTNSYINNVTTGWLLGRLNHSTVQATKPGETLTRNSGFVYHATTGLLTREVIEPGNSALCLVTVYAHDAFGNRHERRRQFCQR